MSDDFSIKEVVKEIYPQADHRLCYIHLQRVKKNMKGEDAKDMLNQRIKISGYDEGKELFEKGKIQGEISNIHKAHIKNENYIVFLRYPEPIRKHIYTTNGVEGIFSQVERVRMNLGGFFQSQEVLGKCIFAEVEEIYLDKACSNFKEQFIFGKAEFFIKICGGKDMRLHNFYTMSHNFTVLRL